MNKTMDVKEKLVELLAWVIKNVDGCKEIDCTDCNYSTSCDYYSKFIADHLITCGVTVQEWISVKDRLPEETKDEYVLVVCDYHGKIKVETRKMWNIDSAVTHWMPLPEPPKE